MKAATHRDQLIGMLTEAAEIEHCLMCTYLYGAFSLKQFQHEDLTDNELAAVRRWRGEIIRISTDEMLHLALVNNLLIALGARPHYRRFNFPISPGLFPADIAVSLAPLDEATLDHFVYLERPREASERDGAAFTKHAYTRQSLDNRLMVFADDYATVGELYEAIEHSLEHLCAEFGETAIFVGDATLQTTAGLLNLPGLCSISTLADARRAVHLIIEQGEGSREVKAGSHYARFSAIRDEWQALKSERPEFVPYRPAARNPVMRSPLNEERIQVLAEPASTLLDAGNAAYGLMLRLLSLLSDGPAFYEALPRGRTSVVEQAVLLMRVVTDVGSALTLLPANAARPGVNAGLTFTVSRQALSYPSPGACAALLQEKLTALAARMQSLTDSTPALASSASALGRFAQDWQKLANASSPNAPVTLAAAAAPSASAAAAPTQPPAAVPAPPAQEVAVGKDVTIVFDGARCIHARHCVLGEPGVFLANTPGTWIHPDKATPERIAIVAHNCPSGAVMYRRHDGGPDEAPPNVNVIRVRENGPLAFHVDLALAGATEESCKTRATLCRCGQSKSKPYCDGSHVAAGFVASGEPPTIVSDPLPDRRGKLSVTPLKDGPLEVQGNVELLAGTGRTINRVGAASSLRLCRCGGSANKPYCDGTHRVNGFAADGQ
ncbi:MAG: ferritin-like domain-containing protein [Burkholderiales bacterium]|nr:ferritin-like domain-containing protein [Burkholderiales bacterium]